jgi:pyrroline-5-carboxylate reductase
MNIGDIGRRGLVLVGCGKMGSAILRGWLAGGLAPSSVWALDPYPSDWLAALDGLHLNAGLPDDPALVLVAVKPQAVAAALPTLSTLGNGGTVFLSVVAGAPMSVFEAALGARTPIVRAMPNTPAAVGKGITALIGNAAADEAAMTMADTLMSAVGQTVRLADEAQMDAVTAVSGSGPAYVFHLIETLAAAGEAQGLPGALALHLARATVAGAAALAEQSAQDPAQLREDVTSPGGTTAAALAVLMDEATGFPPLLARAVHAAAARSRELGQ